jgi:hypothetical protein
MCNRAVGLISRVVESYGIPTVALSINRSFSEKIPAPRTAFIKFPYGAPFGEPGAQHQQMTILRDLLLLLQKAKTPGDIVDLPYKWRRSQYEEVAAQSFIAGS